MAAPAERRNLTVPLPLSLLSDERLAKLVGQGDERAFAGLYTRYHQPLYRYCHSMLRHEADAQDALQSTFTAALNALRRGQRDAPLRPWLFRIAHNESISLMRRRRPVHELSETLPATGNSVEEAAEERARLAVMVADLQALPERQRGALVMRELNGLTHEELAQALGISVGAAKQSVFEARQALQEFAEGRAMACDEVQRVVSDGDRRALRARRIRAHLGACARCQSFAAAIPERRATMLALSPALPAAAASGLFGRVVGSAGANHAGGGGLLAGAGAKSLGAAFTAKSVATGLAVVATATVGTVGAIEVATHSRASVPGHLVRSRDGRSAAHHGHSSGASQAHAAFAPRGRTLSARQRTAVAHAHKVKGGTGATHNRHTSQAGSASGAGSAGAGHGKSGQTHGNSSGNANSHGRNPNAHGQNPNSHGANGNGGASGTRGSANAHGANPNAQGGNPNANGGKSPNAHGSNPNAHGGNSNGRGTNSSGKSTGSTNSSTSTTGLTHAHGSNPNAAGANSHGKGR